MTMENKIINSHICKTKELSLLRELEALKEDNKILSEIIKDDNYFSFKKSKDDSSCEFKK